MIRKFRNIPAESLIHVRYLFAVGDLWQAILDMSDAEIRRRQATSCSGDSDTEQQYPAPARLAKRLRRRLSRQRVDERCEVRESAYAEPET